MNKYQQIQMLSDEQRIEAQQMASEMVIKAVGDRPQRKDFDRITISKYPDWINNFILGLVVIVLFASFIPSAIRLFHIGYETFIEGVNNHLASLLVGLSVVVMAETAQILFSVASVVLETDKKSERLLNASMAAATILALVGNGQVALVGHWTNPFAWLEALLPPLMVLATAYILKQQLLTVIENRHSNERAYQTALQEWQIATSQPEQHPRYRGALANQLKHSIYQHNARGTGSTARKDLMASFTNKDWFMLVNREMKADDWFSNQHEQQDDEPENFTQSLNEHPTFSTNGHHKEAQPSL